MTSSRQLAFQTLLKILKDQSYSNLSIAGTLKSSDLTGADKSFFTTLVYGVLERRLSLDYNLSLYLRQPLKKLNPKVYTALLLGAYQCLFLDKVPDHAAINESVKLVRKNGASFAAGLTNAVLRKVADNGFCLPAENDPSYRSVKYSVPEKLIALWEDAYGWEKTEGLLRYALGPQPLTIRVNTVRTSTDELKQLLKDAGVSAEYHPHVEDALVLSGTGDVSALPGFSGGLFHVQDASSQICCRNADPQPGETVLDLCAAPGGKTCTMAERMKNEGTLIACDLYEHRTGLIRKNADRLGLSAVSARVQDATVYDPSLPMADRVLADVPCAGFGDIGRKPEIRYRDPGLVDDLTALQYNIFNNADRYVVPGGRLVYSTCSLNPAENEAVVERFLQNHDNYRLVLQETYFPQEYLCDGFFNAVLQKER